MVTPGPEQECPELISRWVQRLNNGKTGRSVASIGIDPLDLPARGGVSDVKGVVYFLVSA